MKNTKNKIKLNSFKSFLMNSEKIIFRNQNIINILEFVIFCKKSLEILDQKKIG